MDESEENMSTEDINNIDSPMSVKIKPKKKSLVERELETNLTARVTSPVTGEGSNTSRYGRARRLNTASELETEKIIKPLKIDVSKQPQAYKMHASNSPISKESPKRKISVGSSIEDQIENIYNENISLSRFGSEEKIKTQSPAKKFNKVYIRKDLIQKPDTDTVVLIKNMFSPNKSSSHLNNILERSSEKYSWNGHGNAFNGLPDNCSVVKTLDFDGKRKASPVAQNKKEVKKQVVSPLAQSKNDIKEKVVSIAQSKNDVKEKLISIAQPIKKEVKDRPVSKNELFKVEASCEYQVGDLAWARVGTYPFWPCIVTREPFSDMFVKKKLFGRVERSVIHVTFFGDNGRRGWIVDNMLRKYLGRAEFEACREKFTPESKKKDPRFYAAHFVSEKKLALWNVSVEEAETLMKEPKRLRVDALYNMLEQARAAKTTPSKRDKGGKITRTDSDVSLSESLYDTLFSEDDGKSDDNRSKRARNKSLDVSEVVTACLDNMVARSGITQIQRQSHMDRWLQKAKSKTPEKIQPKLHVKVETEKRKDKARKKKEGKKLQKMRKNKSLGSDSNLLPYQNEHDYSSVNYENHDINDSVNKNTDSASGLDSTLDTSTSVCDIGVTVKIENISSSMEDCSQDDIITTVVNDDIVMTEPENSSKDDNDSQNGTSHKELSTNKVENNNEHMDTNKEDENKMVEVKEELSFKTSNLTNTIEHRRSKRKRQTFEGLNNSIGENEAKEPKEPKLDLKSSKPRMDTTTPNELLKSNKKRERKSKAKKVAGNITPESNVPTVTNLEKETLLNSDGEQTKLMSLNRDSKPVDNMDSITSETITMDNNRPAITNLEKQTIQDSKIDHKETEHMLYETTSEVDIEPVNTENTTIERNIPAASYSEEEISENSKVGAKELTSFNNEATPVVDIEPLNSANTAVELKVSIANCEEETFQNRKSEAMECIPFNNKSTPMVVIDTENAVKEIITPTVANLEEETSKNAEHESTKLTLFTRKSKAVVVIEPLNTENTVKEIMTPTVTNLEIETSKSAEHESTELTLFTSKSKAVAVIEPLDTENTVKEIMTPTVTNLEIETSKSAEHESTELTSFTSKSKAVVVIEPLNTENTVKEIMTPTVTNLEIETSNSAEHESTELTLFNSKSKPVVVIKESSSISKLGPIGLISFHKSSKPVVVIEPLDMNGLETQFIIKGSKQYVLNKNNNIKNKKGTPRLSSDVVKNDASNILQDDNNVTEAKSGVGADTPIQLTEAEPKEAQGDISKEVHRETRKSLADSEGMEVDDCASEVVNQEQGNTTELAPHTEITGTLSNIALIQTKAIEEPTPASVVIGEETYLFDRTLSQDYDEVDGDYYDEYSHLPPVIINEEAENAVLYHEITSLQGSCKDKTSDFKGTEKIPSASDANGSMIVESDSKLRRDCVFLDQESVQNDFVTVPLEDNKVPAVAGDVSSTVNEENNSNQVSQDNNDKCIFLDQSLKTADAQSAENIEKKRKSPRLSLNRTRNRTLKLSKVDSKIQTPKIIIENMNTDSDNRALETASINCIDNEILIKNAGRSQERRDSKKLKNDPEFIKYLEIRQDALLDEQPDITQDEIVTYLYQNWLYEEGKKSEAKKIDDNEQSNLVKGFQELPKKPKKKSKVEKAADLKNLDIRDVLHKGIDKSLPDKSERQGKTLTNHFEHNKAHCEAFNKNSMSQLNKDLQTVDCNKKANTKLEVCGKESVSINVNDRGMSTRRSRRSKDTQETMKTMHELKEKAENKCALETALINAKDTEESITRRSNSSKEKNTNQIGNKGLDKCDIETDQMSSNDNVMFNVSTRLSKERQDTKKAMNEPGFIKYFEMHQDALLDEQPDLTQDEIATYLYQNWLYGEDIKSEIKKIEDNQQYNLVKSQETTPHTKQHLLTLESSSTKANTDTGKCVVALNSSNSSKPSITEYIGSPGRTKEKLDTIQKMARKCVLEIAPLKNSEMSVTKRSNQTNEKNYTTQVIGTEQESVKSVKNITLINYEKDSETADNKCAGRVRGKQDSKKAMSEPEFIKYMEIHQDALLDDQPDLTQVEIVTYLYQNWLYEEDNKSEMKKNYDNEQSDLVKDFNQVSASQPKKIKKKSKTEKAPELKTLDIRVMLHKKDSKSVPSDFKMLCEKGPKEPYETNILGHEKATNGKIENATYEPEDTQIEKHDYIVNLKPAVTEKVSCLEENNTFGRQVNNSDDILETPKEAKKDEESPTNKNTKNPANLREVENLQKHISCQQANEKSAQAVSNSETIKRSEDIEDMEFGIDDLAVKENDEGSKESTHLKIINGFIEFEENCSKANTNEFDSETASIKSEESSVSITRKGRKEKDAKKSMDDPEFLKYLEARQDALIDEQPDLTHEEIVTYLYQTWFYEESTKSDVKKSDETEQSNLVKGLNQETLPQPKKIKKKSKVEKEPTEKVKSADIKDVKVEKSEKVLKNADIRNMIQKPKRKATQSKPYYNEDDSDLEEEDLETFKIFDRDEHIEGEEIDEVELYFEQLTKPKPNVFKGYVRERVCEICYRTSNLVKCKSCHGTYHVECVNKEVEVTEVAGPTRGRKKKRGRKPKSYDLSLETGSQSDERSQDANNSEEINISLEDEAESRIIYDENNFETLWENKMKELQTDNQEEYLSDQEIDWEVEPGHCEIVDLKHKEKPIDYSDYKCIKCLKYETPVCFVCQSIKSPKSLTEVRQKCQVAHCHRYYHLECLDHWPQTQFNSWEPSKTNRKQIEYIEALTCPRHVCHTCVSDDPRGCKTRFSGDKLARCVKCPATYHSYTKCLPAGTQILTGSQIICPRHYEHRPGKVPCHVNTGWCFICALGGTLICCEYCPTSFHAECLNIKPPEGSYMCEDCETGRLPLYGEMVWVKLGHYRWWPGIVLHPTEIPDNILAVKHSQGEFVVRFFGQYDHYWVNRGRVFPFQEGDSGRISSQKSKIDAAFTTAMEHAQRACEILKKMEPNEEEDLDIASSLLPPHYVKLKVNKPAGCVVQRDVDANSLTQCDCDPNQPDPCGPYSHCLNRMLLTECGPLCRAGERCNNRAFERRLYPRLQAYRAQHRGWGLRTLDDIKQGQFVIEYVGELIDMEEFRRRMCRKHEIRDENFYFLTLDKERMIDAGPKGNLARFMNHCCEPNCETQKWTVLGDVRVGLFALYDIPANSEVTFNYNLECAGIEKKRCLCGAKRCSGYIGAKPKQLQEDKTNKSKHPAKRTYKKRKPVEEPIKPKPPKIKIKPIKPRELTEIEKDLLIIKCATNGMSSDSEGSRLSVEDKNPKALKRKRVSFSTDEMSGKKAKLAESEDA